MQATEAYAVRSYHPSDLDAYHAFLTQLALISPPQGVTSQQAVQEMLARPGYAPQSDLWVVFTGQALVGQLDISAEPKINRAILNCHVHPEHRRRGLATRLLEKAWLRLQERGIGWAQFCLPEDNLGGQEFLTQNGFMHMRGFLELAVPLTAVNWQCRPAPQGLHYRPLASGEEPALTQLQNRCFTGSWGFSPNHEEDIRYLLGRAGHGPQDVVVADFQGHLMAYCWVMPVDASGRGRIHMLGVHPECHRWGLGRGVLVAGLQRLEQQGATTAQVTVDSQNAPAYQLYLSIGFRVAKVSLWYQKRVGSG